MSIAISDWRGHGLRREHATDSTRAKLAALDCHGTHVLEEIPIGAHGETIGHLVIGPAGVFTVDTQSHRARTVRVAGYGMVVGITRVPHLRNAKFAAERASRLLSAVVGFDVPVRGCVVILTGSHAPHIVYDSRPIGVSVLTKADVPRWFRGQPAVLTDEQVQVLSAAARRDSTWA